MARDRSEWLRQRRANPTLYAREKALGNKRNRELKARVFAHYSNGHTQCSRCGFADIRTLQLHHINGDGKKQRDGLTVSMYRQLEKDGYPDGLEVLCANCRFIEHAKEPIDVEITRELRLELARANHLVKV
jgi:hypothetical protein